MGQPKKTKKHYKKPRRTWDKARMAKETVLVETYGLKNKREIRRMESTLRKKRHNARKLLGLSSDEIKKKQAELLGSLSNIGVLRKDASAEDVLLLGIEDFMERRLQTMVWRKNLANTVKQARQIIVHGHIAINGKNVDRPGYIVKKDEESKIGYFGKKINLVPKEKPVKGTQQKAAEEKPQEDRGVEKEGEKE